MRYEYVNSGERFQIPGQPEIFVKQGMASGYAINEDTGEGIYVPFHIEVDLVKK